MTETTALEPNPAQEQNGPARDFAAFAKLEYERQHSAREDFDADIFRAAVALVLGKLRA